MLLFWCAEAADFSKFLAKRFRFQDSLVVRAWAYQGGGVEDPLRNKIGWNEPSARERRLGSFAPAENPVVILA